MAASTKTGYSVLYLSIGLVGGCLLLVIVTLLFVRHRNRFIPKNPNPGSDLEHNLGNDYPAISEGRSAKVSISSGLLEDKENRDISYQTFQNYEHLPPGTSTKLSLPSLQSRDGIHQITAADFTYNHNTSCDELRESEEPPHAMHDYDYVSEEVLNASCNLAEFYIEADDNDKPYGSLRVAVSYCVEQSELLITIIEGQDLPSSLNCSILNISLLPMRLGTILTRRWKDVHFDKTFKLNIQPDDILNSSMRFWFTADPDNLDVRSTTEFESMEAILSLSEIDEDILGPVLYTLPLDPVKREVSALCDSAILLSPRPEEPASTVPALLVGLMYISTAGKLVVSVLKARGLGVFNALPDTFVKVTLISPYGDEIGKYKTNVVKQRASPLFDESFVFQVPDQELDYISLTLSVYCLLGVWRRRVLIGWVNVGAKVGGKEQEDHWSDMIAASDDTIARWHPLTEP